MYTDHQGTDDQCALMISVAPAVPCVSAHQCLVPVPVPIKATYHCLLVHINATYQCPSELPFSATYQCCLSVPCIGDAFQCPSVMPVNAHQCLLISVHQCSLSVPITAASLAHISEGEKSLIYKIL
ncbi:unnamed protein product [Staurois parvus]|uniref:Uncharacterized protein n=1 Tax=Staurois parvus TaxID=386267 RepID=A0ABN9D3Y5_9NEOB|nr:unnamed protein product [Staurois parvus]